MKIYFSASISQVNEQMVKNYKSIVSAIEQLGHKVIADHIIGKTKKEYQAQSEREALAMHRKMNKWKKQADISLFEVSKPSLGVGQEIAQALAATKPVICLFWEGTKPHVLRDEGGDLLLTLSYTEATVKKVLEEAIEYASEQQDTRFNFFISPSIGAYLDEISKDKRVPRAVYLRRLIEEDMKQNKEHQQD